MRMRRRATGGWRRWPAQAVIFVVEIYRQTISPLRPPSCRFIPTCSRYAVDALAEYGLIRGGFLSAVRLAKCGPWHPGGWDPIPQRAAQRAASCEKLVESRPGV